MTEQLVERPVRPMDLTGQLTVQVEAGRIAAVLEPQLHETQTSLQLRLRTLYDGAAPRRS